MFNFNAINVGNTKEVAYIIGVPALVGGTILAAKVAYNYFTTAKDARALPEVNPIMKNAVRFGVASSIVGGLAALATRDRSVFGAAITGAGIGIGASFVVSGPKFVK